MLELTGISKNYFNIKALDKVDFPLMKGEVHALIGPNGAGKSTLVKILSGVLTPDEGTILFDGAPIQIKSVQDAQRLGISVLHQEPMLVQDLSVAENIFLGAEPSWAGIFPKFGRMKSEANRLLKLLGFKIHPSTIVRNLSYSQQYIVAIAKALSAKSTILIMDEPSSCLSQVESARLFEVIRKLRREGVAIVYITHRIQEVLQLCDRVTIFRDGKHVLTRDIEGLTEADVIKLMLGRELHQYFPPILDEAGDQLIRVEGLTKLPYFRDISFSLCEGEILGVAGLIGSGRSELARTLFGREKHVKGKVFWKGEEVDYKNIYGSDILGFGLVNQDRIDEGLFMEMGVNRNLTIAALRRMMKWEILSQNRENDAALDAVIDLDIKIQDLDQQVRYLSGGNQQKVHLGKWLVSRSNLFLLDEPTRGIDLESKGEIYAYIHELASSGKGVILFSSDISELIGICTRTIVMYQGQLVAEMHHTEATEEKILQFAARSQDT